MLQQEYTLLQFEYVNSLKKRDRDSPNQDRWGFFSLGKLSPSSDRSKGNLAGNVGEVRLERINRVARALGKSQAQFVREKFDEWTQAHERDGEEVTKRERRIAEREKEAAS